MSGEVIAVGPFRRELVPFLGQAPERYADTRDGVIIVERVFYTPQGSGSSRVLATCMGVEPWDFNTHAFDPWRVNLDREALRKVGQEARTFEAFLALRDAGFTFFFLPNY